ncbi:PIN domain-containing protein [uncultured Frigoribacterium sp.]|uniref:PIN domain-containing protein n=1 Tax=uncultured Frigoribacterium sp. TaxID=335377 RepID=UPI0028D838CF|nr:PIN domain-containing protein [uncultured Frigoribacterium sp.]
MITVVPDTNALFGHAWMTSVAGRNLVDLVKSGECRVVLPQVVVDELDRQDRKTLRSKRDKAKGALSEVGDDITATRIDEAFDRLGAKTSASRDRLLAISGVTITQVPEDRTRALVERDLAARRPFTETPGGKKSYGFRDAVIWEIVLDVLEADRDAIADTVFFVSADNGFINDDAPKELHRHLLEDLDARGIARHRVVLVERVANVVEDVRAAAAEAEALAAEARAASTPPDDEAHGLATLLRGYAFDASRRAELVRVATEALDELVGQPMNEVLTYGGDYGLPDWVQFELPPIGGDLSIYGYDLESDFEFNAPQGDSVTGRADVVLSIEAGDLFGASDDVRARVIVDIDIENPVAFEVTYIVIEGNPSPPRPADPTSVQLDFEFESDPAGAQLDPDPGEIQLGSEPGRPS